jgi:hypothetical protein
MDKKAKDENLQHDVLVLGKLVPSTRKVGRAFLMQWHQPAHARFAL